MKYFLLFTISLFLVSCSSDELISEDQNVTKDDIIVINSSKDFERYIEKLTEQLEENYFIEDEFIISNSHSLENTSITTKALSQSITVNGYDGRKVLQESRYRFGEWLYPSLNASHVYLGQLCEYTKYIEIPKGKTLVIPSLGGSFVKSSLEGSPYNIGYNSSNNPDLAEQGYVSRYISTSNNKDKYALYTYTVDIVKDLSTKKNLSKVEYMPMGINPKTFVFRYQYLDGIIW